MIHETQDGKAWIYECSKCGRKYRYAKRKQPDAIQCGHQPRGEIQRKPESILTCPHRGPILATVTGRVAGAGCAGSTAEVYECRHFREPVLKAGNPPCPDTMREKVPGWKGRTCRECKVPTAKPDPKKDERFDAEKHLVTLPYHPLVRNLAAVTCHFNPQNSEARRRCYATFARQFPRIGMDLYCAEGSLDDRWEIPGAWQYALDPDSHLFGKENLLNLAFARLPDLIDRVLWIDADVLMLNRDYAELLTVALDASPVVQAFRELRYVGPNGEYETGWRQSLGYRNALKGTRTASPQDAYPGLAWAATRELLSSVGGLYDRVISGGGDVAWATAVYGDRSVPYMRHWSQPLVADVLRYGERVAKHVPSVGYAHARGMHLYHGKIAARQYVRRNVILGEVGYDPQEHLEYAPNGTLRWSSAAPAELRLAVREYIHGRKEDQ